MLRLLKHAIDAGALAGKPIAVCGDIAGDPAFTWILLGLGFRDLSMSPLNIPAVRSVVVATHLAEAQEMVVEALKAGSEQEMKALVMDTMRQRFPRELAAENDEVEAVGGHSSHATRLASSISVQGTGGAVLQLVVDDDTRDSY